VGLCQCVQCGWGFFLFFEGGEEKKQNKFPSDLHCPIKKLNPFFRYYLSLSYLSGRLSFYTCCQRLSVAAVRDCGLRHCQATPKFMRGRMLEYHGNPYCPLHFVSNRVWFVQRLNLSYFIQSFVKAFLSARYGVQFILCVGQH
jgi:hypothetical protein